MQLKNITTSERKRRYDDACAATHAMDLLGERWALPVMRELMLGPRRFGELKASINGISANVLTQRLEGLEQAGVVKRTRLPPPASVQVYELTPWGYEAGPIFQVMGRWAVKSPMHDPTRPFSAVSLMLSFRTMMNMEEAKRVSGRFAFRIGGDVFRLDIEHGQVALGRGEAEGADVVFTGSTAALAAAAYGRQSLDSLTDVLTVEGDTKLVEGFLSLFPLPPKAGA